jgi:serine/threonine protein kinase
MIHNAGYTYNDMKLDNILVGDHTMNNETLHKIRLIDFGFANRYIDKSGVHIEE